MQATGPAGCDNFSPEQIISTKNGRRGRQRLDPIANGQGKYGQAVGTAPSGAGFQFSAIGLLGLTASGVEGLELNVLGLTFGINPFYPALKLPIVGRLGPARTVAPPDVR